MQQIGERPPSHPTRRAERALHLSGEDPGECSSWRRSGRAAGASTEPETDPAAGHTTGERPHQGAEPSNEAGGEGAPSIRGIFWRSAAGGADHPREQLRRIDHQETGAPPKATGGQQSKAQEPENHPDGRQNQGAEPPTRRPGREAGAAAGIHTATPGSSPTRSDRQGRRSETAAGGEAPGVQQDRKGSRGSRTERPETTPRGSGRAAGVEIMEARTGSRRRK